MDACMWVIHVLNYTFYSSVCCMISNWYDCLSVDCCSPPHALDHSTISSYLSNSSRALQADTLACCSSSQKQVEVLLFSWPVRHCLEYTIYHPIPPPIAGWLALGGCPPMYHHGADEWWRGNWKMAITAVGHMKGTCLPHLALKTLKWCRL